MAVRYKTLKTFLKHHAVISKIKVQWGEMDAFKHVNNTVYFKYQESARIKFFHAITDEIPSTDPFDTEGFHKGLSVGPILSDTYCKFVFPLTDGDDILVGAHVHTDEDLGKDRFKISHAVWSMRHNRVVATGYGTVVCFNYAANKVEELPSVLTNAVVSLGKKCSSHLLQEGHIIEEVH